MQNSQASIHGDHTTCARRSRVTGLPRRGFSLAMLALLAACGGGGGGDGGPVVQPPAPTSIALVAGSTDMGYVEGAGGAARFANPAGIAVDASGSIFVADEGNHAIRKITPDAQVSTFAGGLASGQVDGVGSAAHFAELSALTIDQSGNLFATDYLQVRKITPAALASTVATIPLGTNIDGRSISIFLPGGIAAASNGDLYITNGIGTRKISASGTTIIEGVDTVDNAFGTRFAPPRGVAVDANGTVYVAALGGTISKLGADGKLVVVAGTAGVRGHADGTGAAASFNDVRSMATDSAGNLYAVDRGDLNTDTGSNLIRKITPAGVVTTVVGTRADGTAAVPVSGSYAGAFASLAVDKRTNTIFATAGNAVYKITPAK
jgi:serine/threonine protein kinase, bacterial